MPVLPDGTFGELTRTSHALAEIANIAPDTHQAYVGTSAFAHKAGLHASAIKVDPELYNHMDPVVVGNGQRVLVTEMAGRASVELKGVELGLDLAGQSDVVSSLVATVKEREAQGWSFEAADASLELLMRGALGEAAAPPFRLESYRVITEHRADGEVTAEATVKVIVGDRRLIATQEGNGPVNALDAALRAALAPSCPWLDDVELSDYKVRILTPGDAAPGTDAVTRVLVGHRARRDRSAAEDTNRVHPIGSGPLAALLTPRRPTALNLRPLVAASAFERGSTRRPARGARCPGGACSVSGVATIVRCPSAPWVRGGGRLSPPAGHGVGRRGCWRAAAPALRGCRVCRGGRRRGAAQSAAVLQEPSEHSRCNHRWLLGHAVDHHAALHPASLARPLPPRAAPVRATGGGHRSATPVDATPPTGAIACAASRSAHRVEVPASQAAPADVEQCLRPEVCRRARRHPGNTREPL